MTDIERDRWGRPLILPPPGKDGKPRPYTRISTLAGTLSDTHGLTAWKLRQAALGLCAREDLRVAITAAAGDKRAMDEHVEAALQASGSSSAATIGTALHSLTELMDTGAAMPVVDDATRETLRSYQEATEDYEVMAVECFGVEDELQVAGTMDRLLRCPDGKVRAADIKTGRMDMIGPKVSIQLAAYAHSASYNPETGERAARGNVDLATGLLIHLPPGGQCTLHHVDIAAGWEAARWAVTVRDWRKRRDLVWPAPGAGAKDPVANAIALARTEVELTKVFRQHEADWTPDHTDLAKAQKNLIQGGLL